MTHQQALHENLIEDERLIWSEEPEATAYFNWGSSFGILFAAFWLTMVLELDQTKNGSMGFGQLFFVAIGVFILGHSLVAPLKSLFTIYGITSKRLLIVRRFPWSTVVESYYGADIDFIRKTRKSGGSGHIVFTTVPYSGSKGRTRYEDVGFFGIDDVDSVEKVIRDTFRPPTTKPDQA